MSELELSKKIASYIQNRANARLVKLEKNTEKQRKEAGNGSAELAQNGIDHEASFTPSSWLTGAATRAKKIAVVTHALKFTHSDAKGSSVYIQRLIETAQTEPSYLSTASLAEIPVDVVGNAAALDVAGLLQLEDGERTSLISRIAQGDASALAPFAESDEQLADWMSGFKEALVDREPSSHTLAKQLYFPLPEGGYHLLSPLYASSLSQALYKRIADSRYSECAKAARKARREEKYSQSDTVDYPNIAVQSFGGTKPQNVSQLNSRRGGKSFLLNCQPPAWRKQQTPPAGDKNAFWREYERRSWKTVKELKDYLNRIHEKSSTKARRDMRAALINEVIDILFLHAAEVQGMTQYRGWSADSELPLAEKMWLDPEREDAEFQRSREANDWQQDIADRFASWLNRKLEGDKLVMKDAEYREWFGLVKDKFMKELRELT